MRRLIQIVLLLASFSPVAVARDLCALPDLKGVATIRMDGKPIIAVWRQTDRMNFLEIYSSWSGDSGKRITAFEDDGVYWQSLTAMGDGALRGFVVRATAGESWFGATKLFVYVNGNFEKVFDSGELVHLVDLNGDGYTEILEFMGNESDPNGQVRIHAWSGRRFQRTTAVPARDIYSAKVQRRLASIDPRR